MTEHPAPSPKRRSRLGVILIVIAGVLAMPLAGYMVGIATGGIKIFSIPTGAMKTAVNPGDSLFAVRYSPSAGELERGQCVIFDTNGIRQPMGPALKGYWVKRIAALPGDVVSMQDGAVHVNGSVVERHGERSMAAPPIGHAKMPAFPLTVPAGHVFLLGDNFGNSLDSRYIGPVEIGRIKYKPLYRVAPSDRIGPIE